MAELSRMEQGKTTFMPHEERVIGCCRALDRLGSVLCSSFLTSSLYRSDYRGFAFHLPVSDLDSCRLPVVDMIDFGDCANR